MIYTVTQYLGESLMFLVVALAPIWALVFSVKVIRQKGEMTPSLAFASACLITAVPYAHYAFSRADLTHISLSVYPLLLAAIAMPIGYLLLRIAGLLIVTLFITVPDHPALSLSVMGRPSEAITVGSDVIHAPAFLARRISNIENALNSLGTKSFVALPDMPGLHAMFNEPMRVRDIYVLFRRSEIYQREEVSRLAKAPPELIFVSTRLLDGRQDLTFARLAPFIQGWIGEHYEQVRLPGMPTDLEIWKVRETVE